MTLCEARPQTERHTMRALLDTSPGDRLPIMEAAAGLSDSKDGKGIGDLVDRTIIAGWVREYLAARGDGADAESLTGAFSFGVRAESRYAGQSFFEAEPELRSEWSSERGRLPWEGIREAVWAGFDRARDRRV